METSFPEKKLLTLLFLLCRNRVLVCPMKSAPVMLTLSDSKHVVLPVDDDSDLNVVASFDRRGEYIYTGNAKGKVRLQHPGTGCRGRDCFLSLPRSWPFLGCVLCFNVLIGLPECLLNDLYCVDVIFWVKHLTLSVKTSRLSSLSELALCVAIVFDHICWILFQCK